MNLTSSSHLHMVKPRTSMSPKALYWQERIICTPTGFSIPATFGNTTGYYPTRTTIVLVRNCFIHSDIHTPPQRTAYFIPHNKNYSVTELAQAITPALYYSLVKKSGDGHIFLHHQRGVNQLY